MKTKSASVLVSESYTNQASSVNKNASINPEQVQGHPINGLADTGFEKKTVKQGEGSIMETPSGFRHDMKVLVTGDTEEGGSNCDLVEKTVPSDSNISTASCSDEVVIRTFISGIVSELQTQVNMELATEMFKAIQNLAKKERITLNQVEPERIFKEMLQEIVGDEVSRYMASHPATTTDQTTKD